MKHWNWRIVIGIILVVLSAVVYFIHFLIFRDAHHIFIYLVADIGFVFIEVLLVTLIIDQLLHEREKKALLHKLNMMIGIFYSEGGSDLLRILSEYDPQVERIRKDLLVTDRWDESGFRDVSQRMKGYTYKMDSQRSRLQDLHEFLREKKDFFLRLLENPNLMEHERFTDTLWAVLHLTEELARRRDLANLPPSDYAHLSGDLGRAYKSLIGEWLNYLLHLKKHYPYLFSLAVRINPFHPEVQPEVTE